MSLIDKSERIDFVGLDLQGEENYTEKDMFYYDDVKEAVLELINVLFARYESFKNDDGSMPYINEIPSMYVSEIIMHIDKIFGDFENDC